MERTTTIREKAACELCRWCSLKTAVSAAATFICRRSPPTAHPMVGMTPQGPQVGVVTVWPEVQREDFCAQFERDLS